MKYYARNQYPGATSKGPYILSFAFLKREHVKVFIDADETQSFRWIDDQTLELTQALNPSGQTLTIRRFTDASSRIVDFSSGAELEERDLDNSALQVFYIAQEAVDLMQDIVSLEPDGSISTKGRFLKDVRDAVEPTDGVNKRQLDALTPLFKTILSDSKSEAEKALAFAEAAKSYRDEADTYAQGASNSEIKTKDLLEQVIALKSDLEALAKEINQQHENVYHSRNQIDTWQFQVRQNTEQVQSQFNQVVHHAKTVTTQHSQIQTWTQDNQQTHNQIHQARDETFAAKEKAIAAANAVSGAVKFGGPWDASEGKLPPKPDVGSVFYKITHGGVLDGIEYSANDNLFYDHLEDSWFKVDNSEAVTSVNDQQGIVKLEIEHIPKLRAELNTAKSGPVSSVAGKVGAVTLGIPDIAGLVNAINNRLPINAQAKDSAQLAGQPASSYVRTNSHTSMGANLGFNTKQILSFGNNNEVQYSFDGHMNQNHLFNGNYFIKYNGQAKFTFSLANGTFTASGNIIAFSDDRLKEDFQPIKEALSKCKQLTGFLYTRKDLKERHVGLLASEVESVLPEAVRTEEKGPLGLKDVKGVAYGNLVALLIESIKELDTRLTALEDKHA